MNQFLLKSENENNLVREPIRRVLSGVMTTHLGLFTLQTVETSPKQEEYNWYLPSLHSLLSSNPPLSLLITFLYHARSPPIFHPSQNFLFCISYLLTSHEKSTIPETETLRILLFVKSHNSKAWSTSSKHNPQILPNFAFEPLASKYPCATPPASMDTFPKVYVNNAKLNLKLKWKNKQVTGLFYQCILFFMYFNKLMTS